MSIKLNAKSKITTSTASSSATASAFTATIAIKHANALCAAREKFETETLARSNKELYGILSEVYGLFKRAVAEECLKETVLAMKAVLIKRQVRVQANTPALTVFVRYVFNSDRKRAYNYASTLMAAMQADVDADSLADFIEGKNGVEECKKEFRKKDATVKKEAEIKAATGMVLERLDVMDALQVIQLKNAKIEIAEGAKFAFVIARVGSNGKLELLQAVSKTTVGMQNAAIKEIAKRYVIEQASAVKVELKKLDNAATAKAAASMTMRELEAA